MEISVLAYKYFNDPFLWNKVVEAHIVLERDSIICPPCPYIEQWAKEHRVPLTRLEGRPFQRISTMFKLSPLIDGYFIQGCVELALRGKLLIVLQSPGFPGDRVLLTLARWQPNYLLIKGRSAFTVSLAEDSLELKKLWTVRERKGKDNKNKDNKNKGKRKVSQVETASSKSEGSQSIADNFQVRTSSS